MNRVLCMTIAVGWLLSMAAMARADEAAIPAIFSVVSEYDATKPTPNSTILQVAAETDIPHPKIYSVSNLVPERFNATSSGSQFISTSSSSCDHCNSDSKTSCNPCGSACSCEQCNNSCGNNGCSDGCGHGCCDQCCSDGYQPLWTFKAGALVMQRASPGSTALVVEAVTGRSLMNASGFSFNWEGGLDASIIRRMGDDSNLEVRYFGINDWTARQSFVTSTPSYIPIFPPFIVPIGSDVTSKFDSSLYSAEINWHHETSETIGLLAGFRWLQAHEALGISFPNGRIRSVTDNQLCGGQIGADLKVWEEGGPLRIDTVIKAGLYNNNASNLLESRNQLAFAGEIGVNIIYQCCDHVALSFGYQVLWLTDVAVASDQIPVINVATLSGLDSGGNIFYHGAMFSVDCSW